MIGVVEPTRIAASAFDSARCNSQTSDLANTPKILLLGPREGGKSTLIKQMHILNNIPFTEQERENYRIQVFYNLVEGMRSLLEAMKELPPLEEPFTNPSPSFPGPSSSSPFPSGPGSSTSAYHGASNGANQGRAVKRPRPAFMPHPPAVESNGDDDEKEGVQIMEPPEGEGDVEDGRSERRREVDGTSTVNTNPNQSRSRHHGANPSNSPCTPPTPLHPLLFTMDNKTSPSSLLHATSSTSSNPGIRNELLDAGADAYADTSIPNVHPAADADSSISTSNPNPNETSNDRTDQSSPENISPSLTRSSSLNIFHLGALTERQQAVLLNELHHVPNIRPGEPFPMEYEGLLRGLWWGWERHVDGGGAGGNIGNVGHINTGGGGEGGIVHEPGVGQHLDRIQTETGVALPDNLSYFFASPEKLSEWFGDNYVPSDEHVLRCRGSTTGMQETVFTLGRSGLGKALRERGRLAESRQTGIRGVQGEGTHGGGYRSSGGDEARTRTAMASAASGASYGHGHGHRYGLSSTQLNGPLRLSMGKTRLHLVDVSGQRSKWQKWAHCLREVSAVLFVVGLSGYSQGMLEDPSSNQMMDAISLWDGVCSSPWCSDTSLILFLNKKDLFTEKMARFPIKNYFPDYEGGNTDVAAGLDYFKRRFLQVYTESTTRRPKPDPSTTAAKSAPNGQGKEKGKEKEPDKEKGKERELDKREDKGRGKGRERNKEKVKGMPQPSIVQRRAVYTHFTTAIDTMQLRTVMMDVCDIIMQDNLSAAHFL